MKKLLLFVAVAAISISACKKDDNNNDPADPNPVNPAPTLTVEKKNRAAVIYFGEDWCPPCGSYGGPTLDSLLNASEGKKLTGIKVNRSSNNSSLNWTQGGSMWSQFNSGVFNSANAIPSMAVNNTKQPVYTNIGTNYNQGIQKADAFIAQPVIAGVALSKKVVGDSIKIETKVKFFEAIAAGSTYKLTTFVVEDDVVASQSMSSPPSPDPDYVHKNMVRAVNGTDYLGADLNNGLAITKNQTFEKTYKIYLKPGWNKNKLKVVAIIWKTGTTPATVVNSNVAK